MVNCPRCGAANQSGRASCWKCWAPIVAPPEPPQAPPDPELAKPVTRKFNIPDPTVIFPHHHAHATAEESPAVEVMVDVEEEPVTPAPDALGHDEPTPLVEETAETPVQGDAMAALAEPAEKPVEALVEAPVEEEPEEAPTAILQEEPEDVPVEESIPDAAKTPAETESAHAPESEPEPESEPTAEHASHRPSRDFVYVADEAVTPPPAGRSWLAVLLLMGVLLSSIFILWSLGMSPRPPLHNPAQVMQQYLSAVAMGDTATPQSMATADSKGLLLPSWFAIVGAEINGAVAPDGATVRVTLSPTQDTPDTMKSTASAAYLVRVPLVKGRDGYLVDQRTFFRNLRVAMKKTTPGITQPPWAGVSQ